MPSSPLSEAPTLRHDTPTSLPDNTSSQVQQHDDENPLGCALDADGNLKDEADIVFYDDPDDVIPLPRKTATTTVVPQGVSSSSKGSKRPRPLDTSEY